MYNLSIISGYPTYIEEGRRDVWVIEAPQDHNVLFVIDDVDFYNLCYFNTIYLYDGDWYLS